MCAMTLTSRISFQVASGVFTPPSMKIPAFEQKRSIAPNLLASAPPMPCAPPVTTTTLLRTVMRIHLTNTGDTLVLRFLRAEGGVREVYPRRGGEERARLRRGAGGIAPGAGDESASHLI